jgi:prepilin-type N-terminal cleavage/methylation domain-containing protein
MNNKGFTLVELVATILILGLIMGIGGYTITKLINKNKQNSYNLLITEIKESLNTYYQECSYAAIQETCGDSGNIILGDLVVKGFLKGNSTIETGANKEKFTLVNPNTGDNIYNCNIEWKYNDGKFIITDKSGGKCPKTEDYS